MFNTSANCFQQFSYVSICSNITLHIKYFRFYLCYVCKEQKNKKFLYDLVNVNLINILLLDKNFNNKRFWVSGT